MNQKILAQKELIARELERRYEPQRADLIEFIKFYFQKECPKGIPEFLVSPFHYLIADRLQMILEKKINRLIINIPPGHGKTELVTKSFPVWALWNNPTLQIISTGYSTTLTQSFSQEAKDYYKSKAFKLVFPRSWGVKNNQDTKEHRIIEAWGSYYATGTGGTIIGKRANIFLIDDPIKTDDAEGSEVKRTGVNNRYDRTVLSRLFNPINDAVVIIMQRTHDDDLCGYLIDKMQRWVWEEFEVLSLPAIATEDELYQTRYGKIERKKGEPLDAQRFPVEALNTIKKNDSVVFSTQYQQDPVNKETQEFHEERYKYHWEWTNVATPPNLRIFTTVDPAFKKWEDNDNSSIMTGGFLNDSLYILEYTVWKFSADVLQDKIIYHIKKWSPEKVGIEAFQAQSMIITHLRIALEKQRIFANLEELTQRGDKATKIRKLVPLYRNWLIYHKIGMDDLEFELKRFPRGKHDDIIDSLQMLYSLYELQPNSVTTKFNIDIDYDRFGRPVMVNNFYSDDFFNA